MTKRPRPDINPGKIFLEEVTTRHKTVCYDCGESPREYRLKQIKGSGKWAKTFIRCESCATEFLDELTEDLTTLKESLNEDD